METIIIHLKSYVLEHYIVYIRLHKLFLIFKSILIQSQKINIVPSTVLDDKLVHCLSVFGPVCTILSVSTSE